MHALSSGAFGWGLADMLAARALSAPLASSGFGQAKNCILIFLWGGPSQIDTFDMKPEAPLEYRGEFQPIRTSVPGIEICEHMPRIAKFAHHLAIVRSLTQHGKGGLGDHHTDAYYLLTGQPPTPADRAQSINRKPQPDDWPFVGSTVAHCRPGMPEIPPVVCLPTLHGEANGYVVPGQFAGRLGPAYEPLRIAATPDPAVIRGYLPRPFRAPALEPPVELTASRLDGRCGLLERLDHWQRTLEHRAERVDAFNVHQRQALSLLTSNAAKRAFDIDRESERDRARYGDNVNGQSTLMARRLIEAGVGFVCVNWASPEVSPIVVNWDTHGDNFMNLRERLLPVFDTLLSALLEDLVDRGLLEQTLVLVMGEMGRTPRWADPRVQGTKYQPGRDHWINCMFALLAGGGIRGGQIYGRSDRVAGYPAEKPVFPGDIAATIYHALGIRPEQLFYTDALGRPIGLLESGEPLSLFG